MHAEQKMFVLYLSWRKKNGVKRLHIWPDLTNRAHFISQVWVTKRLSHVAAPTHNLRPCWPVKQGLKWHGGCVSTVYRDLPFNLSWGQRRQGMILREEVQRFLCCLKWVMAERVIELPQQKLLSKPKNPQMKGGKLGFTGLVPILLDKKKDSLQYSPPFNPKADICSKQTSLYNIQPCQRQSW